MGPWALAAAAAAAGALASCAATERVAAPGGAAPACSGAGRKVFADFAGAGLRRCAIAADGTVRAVVAPESRRTNDSPWYAFALEGPAGAPTAIELRYEGGTHRYPPLVRRNDGPWEAIAAGSVTVSEGGSRARFIVPPAGGRAWIAARPLVSIEAALEPLRAIAHAGQLVERAAGLSADGRPVAAFEHRPPGARRTIVLAARQHPPETTGAVAFDAFAVELFADTAQARAFRGEFAILLLPVLNPDGIVRGHWRGNRFGADLNRDWGRFRQPETRAALAVIEAADRRAPIGAIIDFHSTRRDVIYAPPLGAACPGDLVEAFLARFAPLLAGEGVRVLRSHQPGRGTLKGWALDRFAIAGITFEIGDSTSDERARRLARSAARTLMAAARDPMPQPRNAPCPRS